MEFADGTHSYLEINSSTERPLQRRGPETAARSVSFFQHQVNIITDEVGEHLGGALVGDAKADHLDVKGQ